jgi:hypothetical protein
MRHHDRSNRRSLGLGLVCSGLLVVSSAFADESAIVTDRPNVAASSETVEPYRLQIETAADIETTRSGGQRQTTITTPTKLRLGLTPNFEMHLETAGFTHFSAGETSDTGLGDLDIGFKLRLFRGQGSAFIPSTSLLVALTTPTGADSLSGDAYLLSPTLLSDFNVGAGIGVALNLGATFLLESEGEHVFRFALAVSRNLEPLWAALSLYVELYGKLGFDGDQTVLGADGGFILLLTPRWQIDLTARFGLTDDAPDIAAAFGVSVKL